mmetsp:Transcript_41169/g.89718  ORF Transcript_41169/g.89718 Transcript_41169/m.89718 type:complete len:87 (+) Transcript_41169:56-316(+)|eukprot:CAMPEP_0204323898 /NCGR_PEP_ID=MMETSP0469-20131031/9793_1 /ASSEMBLY_ACC=CAM_ASM_000384 /TAXON_ID=2969 /ORGANISM="Oxyrrhis marina" /LENGTH=86 /DNA_ID=CAMNT_0051305451 /DNA_START=21 /DNA_END=281 /DNA_ORIENTATION=-
MESCAHVCTLLSAAAVPLLVYFGRLCYSKSPMIEIPEENKPDAAVGCWIAASLYVVTFVCSYGYTRKKKNERALAAPRGVEMRVQE